MEDLFFDVYSAKLFLPESIKDLSQTFEFHLLMLKLLLKQATVAGDVFVTRAQRRGVGPTKKGDVPVQLTQSLFNGHQLLAQLLQLRVECATVVGKGSHVGVNCLRGLQSGHGFAALFVKFLLPIRINNSTINLFFYFLPISFRFIGHREFQTSN